MRVRCATFSILIAALLLQTAPARGDVLSKSYNFKKDVTLAIGETNLDGLRLDTVRFTLPATVGGNHMRTGGLPKVEVALSNTSDASRRLGVAIALFDAEGRMVGVASGGSRFAPLKGNRQKTYKLIFDDLNEDAYRAATFQISVESKP